MSDEAAKLLADAMNRLAAALENLPRQYGTIGPIAVQHNSIDQSAHHLAETSRRIAEGLPYA